jgi:hypothetical protein
VPVYGMFEYACHVGNYAVRNMLSASRTAEASESNDGGSVRSQHDQRIHARRPQCWFTHRYDGDHSDD